MVCPTSPKTGATQQERIPTLGAKASSPPSAAPALLGDDENWRNWSRRVQARPARVAQPRNEIEIQDLLVEHAGELRVVGSGHSCTPLCATDSLLVNLDAHRGIVNTCADQQTATIRAGSKIHDLGVPLRAAGLATLNQGDVDVQSLAGAISTGTHGTGPSLGSMSTAVRGLRLVLASGDILECSADRNADVFRAARISLGSLGIISQVELQLRAAYNLHEREWKTDVEEADSFLEHATRHRHLEFFWSPARDVLYMKSLDLTQDAPDPLADRERERIAPSHEVFPSIREDKFNEMEFAVPAERGVECFREIRELMRDRHPDVFWPVEVRTLAADDIPLSPAFQRASVTVSVHQAANLPSQALFADAQAVFANYRARPHWGKFHDLEARTLRPRYPLWDDFLVIRDRLDPAGRLLNPYLRTLFGI